MPRSRILVTGGAGYIGSHACKAALLALWADAEVGGQLHRSEPVLRRAVRRLVKVSNKQFRNFSFSPIALTLLCLFLRCWT
jgi:nucleoside-diphosphate-sugar epimerase